ncbi:MAG: heavy metal translocating P-type ATPase, partial [Bacteroidota bacterium]|nr:heavy metal translocating P-type ATPase [Bacteroidota bacterium]
MSHTHTHDYAQTNTLSQYLPAIISFILLLAGIIADTMQISWFSGFIRFGFYLIPYIVIGGEVVKKAWRSIFRHDYFNEFMLM